MPDREKTQRVTIRPDRPACVVMPDGKSRIARVSLEGRTHGRILTFTFVDNPNGSVSEAVKGKCVKVYL